MQNEKPTDQLLDFVKQYLVVKEARCYRHCQRETRFISLYQEGLAIVGGYACPDNYVSRVVYFADAPDAGWFKEFLERQVGSQRLRAWDIRYATRHGWELGGNAEKEIALVAPKTRTIIQYYWTFYPHSDEDKKFGTFLCAKEEGGCGSLFTKQVSDGSRLCPKCRNA